MLSPKTSLPSLFVGISAAPISQPPSESTTENLLQQILDKLQRQDSRLGQLESVFDNISPTSGVSQTPPHGQVTAVAQNFKPPVIPNANDGSISQAATSSQQQQPGQVPSALMSTTMAQAPHVLQQHLPAQPQQGLQQQHFPSQMESSFMHHTRCRLVQMVVLSAPVEINQASAVPFLAVPGNNQEQTSSVILHSGFPSAIFSVRKPYCPTSRSAA